MFAPLFAADDILSYWPLALGLVGIFVFLIVFFICINFVQLWIQAYLAGAKIGFIDMIRMKLTQDAMERQVTRWVEDEKKKAFIDRKIQVATTKAVGPVTP